MQNDGYRNDRYRRHDPRPHDRDAELRAARGYGRDDREHPGIVSDRDWAGPSEYRRGGEHGRGDYGRAEHGRGDHGPQDDEGPRRHRREGDAFYQDERSRWGHEDDRDRGAGGFGAGYREQSHARRGYGEDHAPRYAAEGYGGDRREGRHSGPGGWDRGREGWPAGGRMDQGLGSGSGRAGQGWGDYGAAGYSQNDDYAQGGQHRGRGPKGYSRSDERVREDVSDRLADDPMVDASDIEVQVSQGEVTLSGHVDSRTAKRRAEDCAEGVSGVRHVQNNLRVKTDGWPAPGMSSSGTSSSGTSSTGTAGAGWSGGSPSGAGLSSAGTGMAGLAGSGAAGTGGSSDAGSGAADTTPSPRS